MGFNVDFVAAARGNTFFRRVLSTGAKAQVVVMSIEPGGEIGEEVHDHVDQILAFVEGAGVAIMDGEESPVGPDRLVHVPAGVRHNVVNRGSGDLRRYTVYAPPQHAPGTIPSHEGRGRGGRGGSVRSRDVAWASAADAVAEREAMARSRIIMRPSNTNPGWRGTDPRCYAGDGTCQ